MKTTRFWARRQLALGALVTVALVLLMPAVAHAFGRVSLKRTTIEEADGRWRIEMTMNYGSKPHLGHIPMDFIFEQKVYYEYSITDGDKEPVVRPKPMHNQKPERVQMDVGFTDARGEIWPETKFGFSLRRDRGFSAGEYILKIQRSSDGQQMGQPIRLTLKGQNELIDRRSIVFTGENKQAKPKKAETASTEQPAQEAAAQEASAQETEPAEDTTEPAASPEQEPAPVQTIQERPGGHGCGCRLQPTSNNGLWATALALVALVAARVRRRA